LQAAMRERADVTTTMLSAMSGMSIVAPRAAFYAMPKLSLPPGTSDEEYVLALLRATGILVVYGAGFGMPANEGYMRIVFLASPDELREIYSIMGAFTAEYLAGR
jgi:alanine-synthesizing transaminase